MGRHFDYLDFYDDGGRFLTEKIPYDDLPAFVKEASYAPREDLTPDDYAVVMVTGDTEEGKFPINDPGNTAISTAYFLHNHDVMPPEAVKVAAVNLLDACRAFRLGEPEELRKLAVRSVAPMALKDKIPYEEVAPITRYDDKPLKRRKLEHKPTNTKKEMKQIFGGEKLKTASALNYGHTKRAAREFNENWKRMSTEGRVKLAQALVPDCRKLGIELDPVAYDYAEGVPDIGRMKIAMQTRYDLVEDPEPYKELEKTASEYLDRPEEFIEKVWGLDVRTGISKFWGTKLHDPVLSLMKTADARSNSEESFTMGADYCTETDLKYLAEERYDLLRDKFGDDFAKQFTKNPITVFKSLPLNTKCILSRMSRDHISAPKDRM